MTSQMTIYRKIEASKFLPGSGFWLEVGHLLGGYSDKCLPSMSLRKGSHLTNVLIWQPQNHGNRCIHATKSMSMFPPGKPLVLLELKVYIICNI